MHRPRKVFDVGESSSRGATRASDAGNLREIDNLPTRLDGGFEHG
jgi:hypothetical protein